MSFSSFKKDQMIFENFRKFVNEIAMAQGKEKESEADAYQAHASRPTPVGRGMEKQKKVFQDLISKEYTTFVKELGQKIDDPKFREFLNMGVEDGDLADDKIDVKTGPIPVKDLRPTQSQIGLADSLGWVSKNKPQQAGETATSETADVGGPIITANGKYIVDGHHRWSQVFLLNPNASIPAVDFQIGGNPDAKKVLKLTQLAIAAVDRVVPMRKADAKTDIFATGGKAETIKKVLNAVISDEMAKSLMGAWGADSKEAVIDRVAANAVALFKRGTHNPDVPRVFMPQLDKGGSEPAKKIAKMKSGDLNWNMKEENKMKITKTQLRNIINEEISSTLDEFRWKKQVTKSRPTRYAKSKRHSKPDHSSGHIGGGFGGTELDGAKADFAAMAGIEAEDLPASVRRIKNLATFEKFRDDIYQAAKRRTGQMHGDKFKQTIRAMLPKR